MHLSSARIHLDQTGSSRPSSDARDVSSFSAPSPLKTPQGCLQLSVKLLSKMWRSQSTEFALAPALAGHLPSWILHLVTRTFRDPDTPVWNRRR